MVIPKQHDPKRLQTMLYSGMVLIIVSMLFLGREQQSASFAVQAFTALIAPAFFYVTGALVWRYLRTVLAAPGLIATGAWLVGVGLIHLYDKRVLLPDSVQPYYWLAASLAGGILITLTGHRVWIWMLVPLVPLTQVNAIWAVLGALGIDVRWMPALSFLLVLAWWEYAARNGRWTAIYRTSAVVLTAFLLLFSLWLPISTRESLLVTWGAASLLIAVLGLRHGWIRMGPLAIAVLTCATIWGLPRHLWPLAWLALAAVTVIFIERVSAQVEKSKDIKAMEISLGLAVLLSGFSALFAQLSTLFGAPMSAVINMLVVLGAGVLLVWIGWRRGRLLAVHVGLWMLASAWGILYFIALPTSGMFGLWLALFAACALLVERVLASRHKQKHKEQRTLFDTVLHWPLADLVMGLSAAIILWTALHITAAPPLVLALTCSIVVGIWLAAGLFYRLPVLLHAALWIAPLPYALLLLVAAPAIWTLPLMGVAWQLLGIVFLVLGHSLTRHRPAILAPFFVVGYILLGFGLSLAMANANLLPVSLGLVILASIGTSIAVIANYHPAWNWFILRLFPAHRYRFAYQSFNHLFLMLSAWLSAIWLHLMLGYTGLPLARQGVFMVVFAALWFVLGRMLSRLPGVVGWPVTGAGWLMWLISLLEVFFSPAEAIITMILGLVISGEALRRSREVYWIPVFILQVFFTVLQVTWMFALPGWFVLLLVTIAVCMAGMLLDRSAPSAGRITAITGAALTLGVWLINRDMVSLVGLNVLAVAAVLRYQRWQWLWGVYLSAALLMLEARVNLDGRLLLVMGTIQWIIGLELVKMLRPRRYRTLTTALTQERDWATPFLWLGMLISVAAIVLTFQQRLVGLETALLTAGVALVTAIHAATYRMRQLPYWPLGLMGVALVMEIVWIVGQPFAAIGVLVWGLNTLLAGTALALHLLYRGVLPAPRSLLWWLRPLRFTAYILFGISVVLLVTFSSLYLTAPELKLANSILLAAFAWLVYQQGRHLLWLAGALLVSVFSWQMVTRALNTDSLLLHSIPVGVILLWLGRAIQRPERALIESAGVIVLLVGAVFEGNFENALSLTSFVLAAHLLALLVYGFVAGRRVPFASAGVVVVGGVVALAARVNIWLIPLACGLFLLAGTIIAEAQGELAEHWVRGWLTRWQQWR